MNFRNVASNLAEAHEELTKLVTKTESGDITESALRVGLLHAYFHLNYAWNTRDESDSAYVNLTKEKFETWGKYPSDIDMD